MDRLLFAVSDNSDKRRDERYRFVNASADRARKYIVREHKGRGYENTLAHVLRICKGHTVRVYAYAEKDEYRIPSLPGKGTHHSLDHHKYDRYQLAVDPLSRTVIIRGVSDYVDAVHCHTRVCANEEIVYAKDYGDRALHKDELSFCAYLIRYKTENDGDYAEYLPDHPADAVCLKQILEKIYN